jgi:uncharacterized protein (DUF1697 family)
MRLRQEADGACRARPEARPSLSLMSRYVALLRGVNVGGRGRIAMADLRACVEGLGHADVRTHIQSGNVLFATGTRSAERVATGLEQAIERDLGFATAVMVRTAAELTAALEADPFPGADPAALHVGFLRRAPDGEPDVTPAAGPDEARLVGREVHLHYPGGMGRSKLTGAWLEKRIGVPLTVRNRCVVTSLRDLLEG